MSIKQFILNNFMNNNTMISQLVGMAQKGNTKQVETFARNFCKERGIDFDKEFLQFKNSFKG